MSGIVLLAFAGVPLWVASWVVMKRSPEKKRIAQVLFAAGALLMLPGMAMHAKEKVTGWVTKSPAETKQIVLKVEEGIYSHDAELNEKYAVFIKACSSKNIPLVLASADAAANAASSASSEILSISIPWNLPDEVKDALEEARQSAANSCFLRGKNAENVLATLTGKGEQYSTTEQIVSDTEKYTMRAALALGWAKQAAGISE
jgi:hypothetical protein